MKSNSEILQECAKKVNPDFEFYQFKEGNYTLFRIIMNAMDAVGSELIKENKILRDDTDFKAMRNYAKELEHRLGINQESGK
ncbi:MAG: hypothetical protein V4547_09020 [Bacteroidota bacterium]